MVTYDGVHTRKNRVGSRGGRDRFPGFRRSGRSTIFSTRIWPLSFVGFYIQGGAGFAGTVYRRPIRAVSLPLARALFATSPIQNIQLTTNEEESFVSSCVFIGDEVTRTPSLRILGDSALLLFIFHLSFAFTQLSPDTCALPHLGIRSGWGGGVWVGCQTICGYE